jgi:hypothetical protein
MMEKAMKNISQHQTHLGIYLLGFVSILMAGCQSVPPPIAEVAVSNAAAGASQFAPVEMNAARDKIARANKAMAAKDYKLARSLAIEAQADAKLAQSKANSTKAQQASDALQDDIRVLNEELDRAGK